MSMFAVVVTYNFDSDVEVTLFPDEDSAKAYLRKRYEKCMADEKAEQAIWDEDDRNLMEDQCECHDDWAEMVWSNADTEYDESEYDYCMWRVVTVSEPREE